MLGQGPANFTCKGSGSHILHFATHMVSLEITQLKKKKKFSTLLQTVCKWMGVATF